MTTPNYTPKLETGAIVRVNEQSATRPGQLAKITRVGAFGAVLKFADGYTARYFKAHDVEIVAYAMEVPTLANFTVNA